MAERFNIILHGKRPAIRALIVGVNNDTRAETPRAYKTEEGAIRAAANLIKKLTTISQQRAAAVPYVETDLVTEYGTTSRLSRSVRVF